MIRVFEGKPPSAQIRILVTPKEHGRLLMQNDKFRERPPRYMPNHREIERAFSVGFQTTKAFTIVDRNPFYQKRRKNKTFDLQSCQKLSLGAETI